MHVHILSHNVRCFNEDKEEELLAKMEHRGIYAACLQETWKPDDQQWSNHNYTIINHCPREYRGQGVAIVLSPTATQHWKDAGETVKHYGTRVMAVRLRIKRRGTTPVHIHLVSAYAPHSGYSRDMYDAYLDNLQQCIQDCHRYDILLIGTDANASFGVRDLHDSNDDCVLGPYGITYANTAGHYTRAMLAMSNMCVASTFFRKSKRHYRTWKNVRSGRPYQIDHFFMQRQNLRRVTDVRTCGWGVDSDHRAILLKIRLDKMSKPKTKCTNFFINRELLTNGTAIGSFNESVKQRMHQPITDTTLNPLHSLHNALVQAADECIKVEERKRPPWFNAHAKQLLACIHKRDHAREAFCKATNWKTRKRYKKMRNKLKRLVKFAKAKWTCGVVEDIRKKNGPEPITPAQAWKHIRELKRGPRNVTNVHSMIFQRADGTKGKTPDENRIIMTTFLDGLFNKDSSYDRSMIDKIPQRRLQTWMDAPPTLFEVSKATWKLSNGKSGGEAKIPVEYYKAIMDDKDLQALLHNHFVDYWKSGSFINPDVSEYKPPRKPTVELAIEENWKVQFQDFNIRNIGYPVWDRYDNFKIATTMQQALELGAKISDLKWAHENRCIIYFDPQLYPDVPLHTLRSDTDGKRFEEWEAARLRLLPKKGDLSLCKNWRGISLLDISSKIFSTILVTRGMKVYEEVGSEEQNGFRCDRGTIDGLFTLRMALCKRREHNIDTWVLFIDLVKAFDSVNHEALFLILQKYGMPDHFINLIIRLHDRAKINLDIGNVDSSIDVSIGVRQGSCEGPMLFLFMMLAAMDTLKMPDHISKPKFMFDDKHGLIGTNYRIKRKTTCFEFFS